MIDTNIIIALITGGVTLICTVLTVHNGTLKTQSLIEKNQAVLNERLQSMIEKNQAVTDTKIEELTREVRNHNNFAQKIPVIESQIKNHEERLKSLENNKG